MVCPALVHPGEGKALDAAAERPILNDRFAADAVARRSRSVLQRPAARPAVLRPRRLRVAQAVKRAAAAPRRSLQPRVARDQERAAPAPAQPSEGEPTRARVAALPASVSWPLAEAQLGRLPVLYDGGRWQHLDATASRHGVVCGASRSGKGNLLQLLALAVLAQGPEQAAVWVLDPKGGLDYAALLVLEHARVYADMEGESPFDGDLTADYRAAVQEMNRRNRLLLAAGARNQHEYRARSGQALPVLVVICDEVAELSAVQQRDLGTLARMSAAAGMVVWVATQYPTAESLPSQVQANALDRVVFQFPSARYTAVALGLAPGERAVYEPSALGQRGVAILRQDGQDICVGRVPLLGEAERTRVIEALRGRYGRAARRPDAVAPGATGAAPGSATEAAPPRTEQGGGENPAPGEGGEGQRSSAERDEVVRRLAGQGLSQRQIRRQLSKRGWSIAQDRLAVLCHEGRAAAAPGGGERLERGSLFPG